MTLPALDMLRFCYPHAKITVISGPRTREIFENNPNIYKFIPYDKHSKLFDKIRQFNELKNENFDLVIDLRNTFFGAFLPVSLRTSPFLFVPEEIRHMQQRHLYKVEKSLPKRVDAKNIIRIKNRSLYISEDDRLYVKNILKECGVSENEKIIIVACGARSSMKRWPKEKFTGLAVSLKREFGLKIVLVGDKDDGLAAKFIKENADEEICDLTAKTTIPQLACLLTKAELLITGDSGIMHLGSYLEVPVVAIFGPTDEEKYGPWSALSSVVKKDLVCRPCEKAVCRFGKLECLEVVNPPDVINAARKILAQFQSPAASHKLPVTLDEFKRILIVRTDRIGDVLLSTPVIKALRKKNPDSYIAMMVSPGTKDIVEGNPYLDEVIIYDKDAKHKGWLKTLKFAKNLKKKGFDIAIILHPTNRVHLVTYLAGIPRRLGYDRKLGFLLTDKIPHAKQLGLKHESEYNFDLLKFIGIEAHDSDLFMPIKDESELSVKKMFEGSGIKKNDRMLAIHPCASCPSKIWPAERFAQAADILAQKYGLKIVVIAGPKDIARAQDVIKNMRSTVVDLSGKISVSQLASVLKSCVLFISNDSGPVHMASALGIPVISIFGRSQPGLSPKRWGPTGKKSKVLHKQVGCIECLAHNCQKEFACLKAITVQEVVSTAESLLV